MVVQAFMIHQKTWPPPGKEGGVGGGGVEGWWGRGDLFSLYIYIENFKNFLISNHKTDFIITWQKCFLRDPLPRLFK